MDVVSKKRIRAEVFRDCIAVLKQVLYHTTLSLR